MLTRVGNQRVSWLDGGLRLSQVVRDYNSLTNYVKTTDNGGYFHHFRSKWVTSKRVTNGSV